MDDSFALGGLGNLDLDLDLDVSTIGIDDAMSGDSSFSIRS